MCINPRGRPSHLRHNPTSLLQSAPFCGLLDAQFRATTDAKLKAKQEVSNVKPGKTTRFAAWRRRRKWTLQQVADLCGRPVSTIAHYESGRRMPDADEMVWLSTHLGCRIADLFEIGSSTLGGTA